MAGETILIVDDTPVNLKLVRLVLLREGYRVFTAASAEEALEILRANRVELVLADIQLPGMDGLEMTRRIKRDPATNGILVVALTAFAIPGDEQRAVDAECDGYITKPIDTRNLGWRVRQYLDHRTENPPLAAGGGSGNVSTVDLSALRIRFLDEGRERCAQFLVELDGRFAPAAAARVAHQWIGTAGLLGYSSICGLARDLEELLLETPVDAAQVRGSLDRLAAEFTGSYPAAGDSL